MSDPQFTIDASEFDAAAAALADELPQTTATIVNGAIRDMVNAVRRNVRAQAKPHRRTGHMASNVKGFVKGKGINAVGRVTAAGGAAGLVVRGVTPHRIAPGRLMPIWEGTGAFKGGKGAGVIGFRKAVQHPGFRGDPWVHRGIVKSQAEIDLILSHAAQTMADTLAEQIGAS